MLFNKYSGLLSPELIFPFTLNFFYLSCDEQQQNHSAKPVQILDKISQELRMDGLVEPTMLLDIKKALKETFRYWA